MTTIQKSRLWCPISLASLSTSSVVAGTAPSARASSAQSIGSSRERFGNGAPTPTDAIYSTFSLSQASASAPALTSANATFAPSLARWRNWRFGHASVAGWAGGVEIVALTYRACSGEGRRGALRRGGGGWRLIM